MKAERTISRIFLPIAYASKSEPTDVNGIIAVADYVGHTIPTNIELYNAISRLIDKKLVIENDKKYHLSPKALLEFEKASHNTDSHLMIWDNLEKIF
jgi:hypothetical protein